MGLNMNCREWTDEEEEEVIRLRDKGYTWNKIAKKLGRSHYSVRNKFRRYLRRSGSHERVGTPIGQTIKVDQISPLTVSSNNAIIASDFHVPGENNYWVNKLIRYAEKNNITTLIVNGDFWNHDSVSRWEFKDPSMNLKVEIKRGIALVTTLAEKFDLYFVCGNHDARLPKALNYSLNFNDWMDALFGDDVTVTNFDHIFLESGDDVFRVCHPAYYSRTKGTQASQLSHDLQENIIMAHQHFLSVSTNRTGKYMCVDCGCMCDGDKFYYKKSTTTKHPHWENGFIHVKNGKVKMISEYTF